MSKVLEMSYSELKQEVNYRLLDLIGAESDAAAGEYNGEVMLESLLKKQLAIVSELTELLTERNARLNVKKTAIFNSVVKQLQAEDHNAAWDEILNDERVTVYDPNDDEADPVTDYGMAYELLLRGLKDSMDQELAENEEEAANYYRKFYDIVAEGNKL